jgi:hypothetical protein
MFLKLFKEREKFQSLTKLLQLFNFSTIVNKKALFNYIASVKETMVYTADELKNVSYRKEVIYKAFDKNH